jgi:peroxiredoxin
MVKTINGENNMKRWAMLPALLLCAAALWAQGTGKAPDFTLQDVDGKTIKASDYLGKNPMLIDFWATWCGPCKQELPHLEKIYQTHKDKGLIFMAISEDSPRSASKVKPYVKSKGFTGLVPMDPDGQVLSKFFGDNTLPLTVLIDREGKIVRTFTGYVPGQEADIEQIVMKMLSPDTSPSKEQP